MEGVHRRVIWNLSFDKHLISYGIIAYCVTTHRWILVNRKYSPPFIMLMRGSYRAVDIPYIIQAISKQERDLLFKDFIDMKEGKIKEDIKENFYRIYECIILESSSDYAWKRFQTVLDLLYYSLEKIVSQMTVEWTFPKGRMKLNETQKDTAEREFSEETGIELGPLLEKQRVRCTGHIFNEIFREITNGRIYETKCWLYIFYDEVDIPNINDKLIGNEIGRACWVTFEEACDLLKPSKKNLLLEAFKKI